MNFKIFKQKKEIPVLVEVSARHCHLSKETADILFGTGYEFNIKKQLRQPADFACQETVALVFGFKKFDKIRVVGPLRSKTQVEISLSDTIGSEVEVFVKISGDIANTPKFKLIGPAGEVELENGLIVAQRHIHCATSEAKKLGLKDGEIVSVKTQGNRSVIFNNVKIRLRDDYALAMHIDTDEANAAGIDKKGEGTIIFK